MIFPIGDENIKGGSYPVFSYGFILLNVLIFLFQASIPSGSLEAMIFEFGSIPLEITAGQDWHTLLTSMFLHGGWMHLLGNMLFLWIFADNIESTIGHFRFVIFYLAGGIAAALTHIMFNLESTIPMIGASGAIAAVLGAYIVMYPASRVKVLVFVFPLRVPAFLFLGFWIYEQTVSGVGELSIPTAETQGIAWWAHIGGFVFGLLGGLFFRSTARIKYKLEE